MTQDQEFYTLEKSIWTQDDYEGMGWHDCPLHGFAFLPSENEGLLDLALDIDYIFKWVMPESPYGNITFWLAPCTLIFPGTQDLKIEISDRLPTTSGQGIMDLTLVEKKELVKDYFIYEWNIEWGAEFRLKSTGFRQIVRQKPIYAEGQSLSMKERGGIGFGITPCEPGAEGM